MQVFDADLGLFVWRLFQLDRYSLMEFYSFPHYLPQSNLCNLIRSLKTFQTMRLDFLG